MAAKLITFEGEARSGKGTSVRAVREALLAAGHSVVFIDQGQKFRVLARLAIDQGIDLSDQDAITTFLNDTAVREKLLQLLDAVTRMEQPEIDTLLYTPEVGTGSAQFGANPATHPIVLDLLFSQVERAAQDGTEVILVDGRTMAQKGRQMHDRGVAEFLLGFYFRCDTAIAARRTEGIFVDMDKMSVDDKLQLLDAITRISDRNRQDTLRDTDPMREPFGALPLHTDEFRTDPVYVAALAQQALESGVVSVNTSYTKSVTEMTDPVVAIATHAVSVKSSS